MTEELDWKIVASLNPKGDCSVTDHLVHNMVFRGPIKDITFNEEGGVVVTLKWVAQTGLPETETSSKWVKAPDENLVITFPNMAFPFVIEQITEKQQCVRFWFGTIYIDDANCLEPSKVEGLFQQKPYTASQR